MPVKIPNKLPAAKILTRENIFVMDESRASTQNIRPLKIAILNLMPTKVTTETQLLRLLGNTPLQIEITLLNTASYNSQNTSSEHLSAFYKTFKEINQLELVNQAGIRQQYIDQSVSLNLAFPSEATPKWLNKVHMEAWRKGVKTLYYTRTESVLRGDLAANAMDESCLSCDG